MTDHDPLLHRDMGRLEARLQAAEMRAADMQRKVDEMHSLLMQAKGGWRAMVMVGSVSAAVGALAAKVVAVVWPHGGVG